MTVWHADIDWTDPLHASDAFADEAVLALLDSGGTAADARYSYLCIDPFRLLEARGSICRIDGEAVAGAPLDVLARELARWRIAAAPDDDYAFRGGAAGYVGYEVGAAFEPVSVTAASDDDPPDLFIGFYDLVIGFDRVQRKCRIHASGLPYEGAPRRRHAQTRLEWARTRLAARAHAGEQPGTPLPPLAFRSARDQDDYRQSIRRTLDYIAAGDIFQANITHQQVAPRPPGLAARAIHAALRTANPAPFGAWLRCGAHELCCSSPERFLRLDSNGTIETCPIKGTAPRADAPDADAQLLAGLRGSEKDHAENVMIVDVLRHDLGRVAIPGSIAVPDLAAARSYATVHHLVSRIIARLRPGLTAMDLLRAALPGGSITGAPKVRAMQIIAELEPSRRGPYCGNVVWLGFDGTMDSNIVIRSLVLTPTRVIVQAGGGIVADSNPDGEYAEMRLKLAPVLSLFTILT